MLNPQIEMSHKSDEHIGNDIGNDIENIQSEHMENDIDNNDIDNNAKIGGAYVNNDKIIYDSGLLDMEDALKLSITDKDTFIIKTIDEKTLYTFGGMHIYEYIIKERQPTNTQSFSFIEKYICHKEDDSIKLSQSKLMSDVEFLIILIRILKKINTIHESGIDEFICTLSEHTITLIATKSFDADIDTETKNKLIKYSTGLVYFTTQYLKKYLKVVETKYDSLKMTLDNIKETENRLEKIINKM